MWSIVHVSMVLIQLVCMVVQFWYMAKAKKVFALAQATLERAQRVIDRDGQLVVANREDEGS